MASEPKYGIVEVTIEVEVSINSYEREDGSVVYDYYDSDEFFEDIEEAIRSAADSVDGREVKRVDKR